MSPARRTRLTTLFGAAFGVLLLLSLVHAQPRGKAYAFRGKIEKIDTKAKTLTVNGENVQGWMAAMTMTYSPDKEDVVTHVKVGDEITATVYEADFKTLYDVQVVPPKGKEPPAKK